MTERIIVAGFGGQGILFLGRLLAQAAMGEGSHVTFFPAYGPEVRGGRANCHVIVSSDEIFSPRIAQADAVLAMNQVSWDYFSQCLEPEGLAVVNASMVEIDAATGRARLVAVSATDIADEVGDVRATNMVMLGAYTHARKLLPVGVLLENLRAMLAGPKAKLFELNRQALQKGIDAAEASVGRAR